MVEVTKKSGEREPYSEDKLRDSLKRAGAKQEEIEAVVKSIEQHLYDGIPTTKLYAKAFDILREKDPACAGRYSLKEGLRQLGPTGFPFERLTAKIFEHKGFKAKRDQVLQGDCITHEVDVIAYEENKMCHIVECKFHSDLGYRMSVHVPMYMKGRFDDIYKAGETWNGIPFNDYSQCWIVHNAKLSQQSQDFSKCYGINLIGWRYPRDEGLEYYIEKFSLYPITTLTQIDKEDAHNLIEQNIVLCKEIEDNQDALKSLGYSQEQIDTYIQECDNICQG